jgi:hypothetical protein
MWGYGGVVQAPDGAIWKVATSAKKDTGPATRQVDKIVLLMAATDVGASKRFYVDNGLSVGRASAGTSSSPCHPVPSSWGSMGDALLPRTLASLPTAPDRID